MKNNSEEDCDSGIQKEVSLDHISDKTRCGQCRFWAEGRYVRDGKVVTRFPVGECHRHPPCLVATSLTHKVSGTMETKSQAVLYTSTEERIAEGNFNIGEFQVDSEVKYPLLGTGDWCGEWEQK